MKKILFLSGWYYPDSVGGTENYVCWLAKELSKNGFKVQIAAPAINGKESGYIHEGINVYRYPVSLSPSRQELRGQAPQKYRGIFTGWLKENKPDLVHIHSFTRGCGLNQAKVIKEMGVPLVFTAHVPDLICKRGTMMRWGKIPCDGKIKINRCAICYLQKKGLPRIVSWPLTFLPRFVAEKFIRSNSRLGTVFAIKSLIFKRKKNLKRFFKMADYIICVSQWLHDVISTNECSRRKMSIIRHGLPHNYESETTNHLEKNKGFFMIGYLGRFHYIKGVHILIKAIKKLPRTMRVRLKLQGSASSKEEEVYLDKLKKEAAGDYRIQFCGRLKQKDKNSFFKEIDILAIPSLWFEAGPLVALESFFHKVPVIGSNLGGIAELVKDKKNGILVKPGNIKEWVKQIKNIYFNRDSIESTFTNIPKIRSMQEVAKENVVIYGKVLSQK